MATCANCDSILEKRSDNKGYIRYSLEKATYSGQLVREALSSLTESAFTPVSTNFYVPFAGKKTAVKSLFEKKSTRSSKWDTIITCIRARQYGKAIKGLYEATKGSKRQFLQVVSKIVRKEVAEILKPDTSLPLCRDVDIPSIRSFSWEDTLNQVEKQAPLMFSVVKSTVSRKSKQTSLHDVGGVNLKPKLGTAIALLLHTRAPIKASFLPTLFSIQFWCRNLKRETIKQLSKMGICKGYEATLKAIDKIRQNFDSAATSCKLDIEAQLNTVHDVSNRSMMWNEDLELSNVVAETLPNIEDEVNGPSDIDSDATLSYDLKEYANEDNPEESFESSDEEKVESDDEDTDEELNEIPLDPDSEQDMSHHADDATLHPGITMCWDNVGKKVTSRHPTITSTNKYINMALGYMAVNRVTTSHLQWEFDDQLKKATDLSHETYVPSQADLKSIKRRMEVIVGRIITRHLKWFKNNFSECTVPHIVHEHSAESSHRSVLINLGLFDVNPSSTQGAITIYDTLQKYVPPVNEKPYTTAVYGDGLSCERGNDAHRARANGLNPWERLEGCEPAAQEFHKEMLLLQDYYDLFFKGSSAADKGTLCHLKNVFYFRKVKSDVSDNFTHAWELMCLITEGFVCLLTMQLLEMEDHDCSPGIDVQHIQNGDLDERNMYFSELCSTVVQRLWHSLNTNALTIDDGTGPPIFCCGEDFDDNTIACTAGSNCTNGEVFHYLCADIDENNLPQNWYCSDECRNRMTVYAYCLCRQDMGNDEPMIGCAAGSSCIGTEWYHMKCMGIHADHIPKGDWFCQETCKTAKRGKKKKGGKKSTTEKSEQIADNKYNYTRAAAWIGLNLLCRRDAVREADGEAMIAHWRLDLVHFFTTKHPKYLILAHRLLASVNGWLPEKTKKRHHTQPYSKLWWRNRQESSDGFHE